MDDLSSNRLRLSHLLILALVIRVALFFGGVRGSDAYAYAQYAYNIAEGRYDVMTADTQAYYGFRYAVLLPTAAAYALFGANDWSSALFPLLASLATLVLVVRLGIAWLDRETALLAGLLHAFFPLDVINATLLGPSSFIPVLSAGAMLAFWQAGRATSAGSTRAMLYLTSGICIGMASQARAVGLLLLGTIVFMTFGVSGWRARLTALGLVGAGCVLPLALESVYYWYATGDPLYRMTAMQSVNEAVSGGFGPEYDVSWAYYPRAMLGLDLGGFAWFGFFGYLAVGAVGLALARKELRRVLPLLLWAVPVFAYLEFGSMSLTRYLPIWKAYTYLSLISVPMVLLGSYGLTTLCTSARSVGTRVVFQRIGLAVLLAGLAVTSLYGSYRVRQNIQDDARPYQIVANAVQAHPQRIIYVPHERWALFLNYYLGYQTGYRFFQHPRGVGSGRFRDLWEEADPRELPMAYVVLHDRYLYFDTSVRSVGRDERLPNYVFNPPASWRTVVQERAEPAYNSFVLFETDGQR